MPEETNTTLRQRAYSPGTTEGLKEVVSARLKLAQSLDTRDPAISRHVAALAVFNDFLGPTGPSPFHPLMWALWLQQGAMGDTDTMTPGATQLELLSKLGMDDTGGAPDPDTTLVEFVAAGVDDLVNHFQQKLGAANEARANFEADASDSEAAKEALSASESELLDANEQIDRLTSEKAELEGKLTYLQGMGVKEKKPRRTSVPAEDFPDHDVTGVFYNERVEGRPLEILWKDDEGKNKYKTLDGVEIADAIALRTELNGKPSEVVA